MLCLHESEIRTRIEYHCHIRACVVQYSLSHHDRVQNIIRDLVGDCLFTTLPNVSQGRNFVKIFITISLRIQQMFERVIFLSSTFSDFHSQNLSCHFYACQTIPLTSRSFDKKEILLRQLLSKNCYFVDQTPEIMLL